MAHSHSTTAAQPDDKKQVSGANQKLTLHDIKYVPTAAHVTHYVFSGKKDFNSKLEEPFRPYEECGHHTPVGGSSFLHIIASVQCDSKHMKSIDPYFEYVAARLASLRLYEYFLDEEIKLAAKDHNQEKRKQLQVLKEEVILENELTMLVFVRHVGIEYGVRLEHAKMHADACKAYGVTKATKHPCYFDVEEGYLSPGLSASFADYDLLFIEENGLDRLMRHPDPNDPNNLFLKKNLFAEWLLKQPTDKHKITLNTLPVDYASRNLDLVRMYREELVRYPQKKDSNFSVGFRLMQRWRNSLAEASSQMMLKIMLETTDDDDNDKDNSVEKITLFKGFLCQFNAHLQLDAKHTTNAGMFCKQEKQELIANNHKTAAASNTLKKI